MTLEQAIAYTPAEFARMIADQNYFVVAEILAKGKVVYERQPEPAPAVA